MKATCRCSSRPSCRPYLGLAAVTSAALLFGVVASLVKYIDLPPLLILQLRSIVNWLMSVGVVAFALRPWRGPRSQQQQQQQQQQPQQQPQQPQPRQSQETLAAAWCQSSFGPASVAALETRCCGALRLTMRTWLAVRALLYWGFIVCWWLALSNAPVGDATAVVYCGPLFTVLFAWLLLSERLQRSIFVCMPMAMAGVILIVQPEALFGGGGGGGGASTNRTDPTAPLPEKDGDGNYGAGIGFAFAGAVVAGLLPVCVRASKGAHWATVEHVAAAWAAFILTPLGLGVQAATGIGADELSRAEVVPKLPLILLTALVGFSALALQTIGYQREKASRASVMTFLEIPFAFMLQAVVFKQEPNVVAGAGIALVMLAGILNVVFADLAKVVSRRVTRGRRRKDNRSPAASNNDGNGRYFETT